MVLRDWLLHWVRSSGDRISTSKKGLRRRDDVVMRDDEAAATSAGCMCAAAAVFHIFDTHHHLQFPLNHHRSSSSSAFLDQPEEREIITPSYTKGVEAPRNSLEVDTDSNSVAVKEEQDSHLHIPIQIKTKVSSPRTDHHHDLSSECSSSSMINSPATAKTPSLVARLMGLDLLPEECCSSPSLTSCSNSNAKKMIGTSRAFQTEDDISVGPRSLPETPRVSSARRSDVHEYYHHHHHQQHHRLSLNEERKGRFGMTQSQDENRVTITSPRHYAKQILKNVKESVMSRRRVGLTDITNTNMDRETRRRDQNLILIEPTKNYNKARILDLEEKKCTVTAPSPCSPKLRFLETTKNSKLSTSSGTKIPRLSSSSSSSDHNHHKANGIDVINQFRNKKVITSQTSAVEGSSAKSCNNSSEVSKLSTHPIKSKKEEQFVRSTAANKANLVGKKCKKTPLLLSSDVLRIKQVKKDPSPSPTKLPQKQVSSADAITSKRSTRLSSKPSHSSYSNNNKISLLRFPENAPPLDQDRNGHSSTSTALHGGDAAAEYGKYIQLILKRACITKRFTKWHSPEQPIDPFIFYHFELFHYGGGGGGLLSHRCNRKLIFQLMNELLAHIMIRDTDYICRLGLRSANDDEGPLIDELCQKIDDFPAAKCEVLEDIDSIIDTDMCKWESNKYCDVELESIVSKIEGEMVELLVKETVVVMRNDVISY